MIWKNIIDIINSHERIIIDNDFLSNICKYNFLCDNLLTSEHIGDISKIKNNGKKKILLVDDSKVIIKLIHKNISLKNPGFENLKVSNEWNQQKMIISSNDNYDIIMCCDGIYAKDIANMIKFNLIITDVEMPIMSGIELIKELYLLDIKDTKIIVYTSLELELLHEIIHLFDYNFYCNKKSNSSNLLEFLDLYLWKWKFYYLYY